MRYAPSERLFRLARLLAGTRVGLTLDEMAAALGVKRRTAERIRDTLEATFPELRHHDDDQRIRRWLLPGSALVGVVEPRAEAAARWLFHPTQRLTHEPDGSLTVLHAGGIQEMCWHLFTWGTAVRVIAPRRIAQVAR